MSRVSTKSGLPRQRKNKASGGQLHPGVMLYLVALMAVQPVLAPLHLALADHRHRYNSLSGLFEDVIDLGGGPADRGDASSSDRGEISVSIRSRDRIAYAVCPTANLFHLRYTTSSPYLLICSITSGGQSASSFYLQVVSETPVFMTAPKQSPPTVLG